MAEFMKGCEAIAEAAVRAGCRFYSGYPITPQSEIMEYLSWRLPEVGGVFVQGESEIAAINMVYGASSTGVRAMTSSSSTGVSLKTEGISYMASTRLPGVIVSAMRCGPGLGMIQPSQMDYLQATKAPGHGGVKCLVFAPSTVQECVDLMGPAFDKAFRDRHPVIMLVDGCMCAIMEPVELPPMRDVDAMEEPSWALTGNEGRAKRAIVPCLAEPEDWEKVNLSLKKLYDGWKEKDVMVEEFLLEGADYVIAAYGTSARVSRSAIRMLRAEGIKVGMIRPITVNPFPTEAFRRLDASRVKKIVDVEMAIPAQMVEDVERAVCGRIPIVCTARCGGVVITKEEVYEFVKDIAAKEGIA